MDRPREVELSSHDAAGRTPRQHLFSVSEQTDLARFRDCVRVRNPRRAQLLVSGAAIAENQVSALLFRASVERDGTAACLRLSVCDRARLSDAAGIIAVVLVFLPFLGYATHLFQRDRVDNRHRLPDGAARRCLARHRGARACDESAANPASARRRVRL